MFVHLSALPNMANKDEYKERTSVKLYTVKYKTQKYNAKAVSN